MCVCVGGMRELRGWTNINVWEKVNLSASKALCKADRYNNIKNGSVNSDISRPTCVSIGKTNYIFPMLHWPASGAR